MSDCKIIKFKQRDAEKYGWGICEILDDVPDIYLFFSDDEIDVCIFDPGYGMHTIDRYEEGSKEYLYTLQMIIHLLFDRKARIIRDEP